MMAFFLSGSNGNDQNKYSDAVHEEGAYCNSCRIRGLNGTANVFCPTCCVFLCHTCNTQHQQLNADHCLITGDFSQCRDYVNLKKKISYANVELIQAHNEAENNINLAERYRDNAIEEIQQEREKINRMFDEQKAKVNSELDHLETEIKTTIINKYTTDCEKFKTVVKDTESLKKDIQTLTQNFSPQQLTQNKFPDSMTKYQQELAAIKPKIKQAVAHNEVTMYRFEPKWEQNVTEIKITKLGAIHTLDPQKATAAVVFIRDINVNSSKDSDFCNIKGMCFLSKQFLVIADTQNESLKVIDREQYKIVSVIDMPAGPRDVTKVNDHQIAVTLPSLRLIQVLNISSDNTLSKTIHIPVNGTCRGIVYNNGKLFVSFHIPSDYIEIFNMDGTALKKFDLGHSAATLEGPSVFEGIGLSPDHKNIYIADEGRDTITCTTTKGTVKAIYRNNHFEKPRGLTVARNGLVFVSGKGKVHQLSSDLSHGKIMLDRSHGIHSVQCVLHCENENTLYIGMIGQNMIKKFQIL